MRTKPIRVLIVDDSALVRSIASASLAPYPDIQVVGTASDAYIARDRILELRPDVLTLDVEMPRMDGISFLRVLMKHHPMPVIIMSSLTGSGSEKALEALQAGAIDVMSKPNGSFSIQDNGAILAEKIRAAADARVEPARPESARAPAPHALAPPRTTPASIPGGSESRARRILLVGASTGGTEALKTMLTSMCDGLPGICIVQHIPAYFSKAFADRLNQLCAFEVREAKNGDAVRPGLALVAAGGYHMILRRKASQYSVELNQGPPVHHQRPAVDILFQSAVKCGAAPYTVAALLTGMGSDGATGLLGLRQAGASTIAQNEATSVVFGMPREAIRLGAVQHVLPLEQIGPRMQQLSCRGN